MTRAELVRHGFAVLGRPPAAVLPEMSDDDVREAARAVIAWRDARRAVARAGCPQAAAIG